MLPWLAVSTLSGQPSACIAPHAQVFPRVVDVTDLLLGGDSSQQGPTAHEQKTPTDDSVGGRGRPAKVISYKGLFNGRDPAPAQGSTPGFIMMQSWLVLYRVPWYSEGGGAAQMHV